MWKARNPTGKPLISYPGTFPDKLYRYRSVSPQTLDRLINFEILEEGIYLAGLKDLNDPDEGRFLVSFEGTRDEIASYWKEALKGAGTAMSTRETEVDPIVKTDFSRI